MTKHWRSEIWFIWEFEGKGLKVFGTKSWMVLILGEMEEAFLRGLVVKVKDKAERIKGDYR